MEKRLREDKWRGQGHIVNEGQNHDLHPDQGPQSQFSVLLLWSRPPFSERGRTKKRRNSNLILLTLHSSALGQGIYSPAHPIEPTEGAPHWRSQSRAVGEETEGCCVQGAESPAPGGGESHVWSSVSSWQRMGFWSASQTSGGLVGIRGRHAAVFPWAENPVKPVFLAQNHLRPGRP